MQLLTALTVLLRIWNASAATTPRVSGSSFAGSTSTAVFPPPGADVTQYSSLFPGTSEVGFPGPTPTGDQPEVVATAAAGEKEDIYPLTPPPSLGRTPRSSFSPIRSWGNLSPFFSVDSAENGLPGASPQVPDGCTLSQVHLLHRHGARYPTSGGHGAQFASTLQQVASGQGFSVSGPLTFLSDWTYKLGSELLLPFGRQQLFENGVAFRLRYGKLLDAFERIPVVRTTSQARMVDTAVSFSAGFFGVQEYQNQSHLSIAVETPGLNTTLASYFACPNFVKVAGNGRGATSQWAPAYLSKTVGRLQRYIKGLELNATLVYAMQELCAYETVALGYSQFCGLFTKSEWDGFEYAGDLDFWYLGGPGNPVASALGTGYIQELVARLTQTPLTSFNTSTNSTLNGNNVTFPLDQPMQVYLDFTHDIVISSVAVAMNFTSFAEQGPLPVTHVPRHVTYKAQNIVPFAANLVGQVLACPASHNDPTPSSYIRWLLNDGVVPLTGIKQCAGYKNKDGLCPLSSFVAGMQEILAESDWNYDCYGNWTVPPVPNDIVNGRPPRA
ncbi:phosphoglycerate mutase-like protein [Trametopsis cervina]|nr:phosphoglycerate mutase-like protein [Trametopsis cervina]